MTGADPAREPVFDPRFDPRFQKGYSADAGAGGDGGAADVASDAYASAGRAEPAARVEMPDQDAEAPPREPPAAALFPSSAQSITESSGPVTVADSPDHADGAVEEFARVDPPDEPPTDPRRERNEELARLWMLAAWAVALACIVVGFGLFWAANDDASFMYVGIPTAEEQLLQALGWWLAPPLVEVGIIGVITLLVIGGVRRAQRHGRRTDRG